MKLRKLRTKKFYNIGPRFYKHIAYYQIHTLQSYDTFIAQAPGAVACLSLTDNKTLTNLVSVVIHANIGTYYSDINLCFELD
jgi:hypothetical protein